METPDLLHAELVVACEKCGTPRGQIKSGKTLPRGLCGRCYMQEHRAGRIDRWAKRRARRAYCKRGHALTKSNTLITFPAARPQGKRCCKKCKLANRKAYFDSVGYRTRMRHGITEEQYAALLKAQGGTCAICHKENPNGRRLEIDHDHSCCPQADGSCGNCVRGLLCRLCNVALGAASDSPSALRAMADYLERHARIAKAS